MNDGNFIEPDQGLFSIGTVMKQTGLTARQIRYYEQNELILPIRTDGNQRMYSFNDIERLKEIKALIAKGINMAGIKQMLPVISTNVLQNKVGEEQASQQDELSDEELHRLLKRQLFIGNQPHRISLIQGELSQFFKK